MLPASVVVCVFKEDNKVLERAESPIPVEGGSIVRAASPSSRDRPYASLLRSVGNGSAFISSFMRSFADERAEVLPAPTKH